MYFMDSDDWAEPTMLEDMYKLAKRDNAQLVVAGFFIDTYYDKEHYVTDDYVVEDAVYRTKNRSGETHTNYLTKIYSIHLGISSLSPDILWKTICVSLRHSGMISRSMSAL